MNHALLMGVFDGVADIRQQFQPLARAQSMLAGKKCQRRAADQFHGKIRLRAVARVIGPCFKDVGDAGMLEAAEDLGFMLEAPHQAARHHPRTDDLECDDAAGIVLLGLEDRPHPAFADLADQAVTADAPPACGGVAAIVGRARRCVAEHFRRDPADRLAHAQGVGIAIRRRIMAKQIVHGAAKVRIVAAGLLDKCAALALGKPARFQEDRRGALEAFAVHAGSPLLNSLLRKARATVQSSATVARETSITSAIDSLVNPPKNFSSTTRHLRSSSAASFFSASSSASRSTSGASLNAAASLRLTRCPSPPPRFAARWRRT